MKKFIIEGLENNEIYYRVTFKNVIGYNRLFYDEMTALDYMISMEELHGFNGNIAYL